MAGPKDLARIKYVLEKFDNIINTGDTTNAYANADSSKAKILKYEKRINGMYYVAEAVPDSAKKRLIIQSAYKEKPQVVDT
jgi:hypothetical protein